MWFGSSDMLGILPTHHPQSNVLVRSYARLVGRQPTVDVGAAFQEGGAPQLKPPAGPVDAGQVRRFPLRRCLSSGIQLRPPVNSVGHERLKSAF